VDCIENAASSLQQEIGTKTAITVLAIQAPLHSLVPGKKPRVQEKSMKIDRSMLAVVAISLFAGSVSPQSIASSRPYPRHIAGNPVTTGLGECIDFLIYGSDTLTNQVNSVPYTFQYSIGAWTDHTNKVIYIQNYACPSAPPSDMAPLYGRVAQVTHELGHVVYYKLVRIDTRQNYIDDSCEGEGAGVSNNIVGRNEIMVTSNDTVNIGLVGTDSVEPQMEAIFGSTSPPDSHKQIGSIFCPNNVTSTTGEIYTDYYGRMWDERYGNVEQFAMAGSGRQSKTDKRPSAFDLYALWQFVDETSESLRKGASEALKRWPVKGIKVPGQGITPYRRIPAGRFVIGRGIVVSSSEIRLNRAGEIVVSSIDIDPSICISRNDVAGRYSDLYLSETPSGHSILEKTYWSMKTKSGKVSFGFSEQKPECLSNVVFDPQGG
jgi:hypothetical protein